MINRQRAERASLAAAGVVITALTAAAFWLSYAHLAAVARTNGLGVSPARTWAWPATLDLFIVAGELLMLRAGFRRERDWWAIGLTVAGSVGSIGLNVAGVGPRAAFLAYLVAAVPPTAALLAFGALMRQVHGLFAEVEVNAPAFAPVLSEQSGVFTLAVPEPRESTSAQVDPVDALPFTPASTPPEVDTPQPDRLDAEEARRAIKWGWVNGTGVRETAAMATRSPSYVSKVFAALEEEHGPRPVAGQLALVQAAP